jgi:hypothetical protein
LPRIVMAGLAALGVVLAGLAALGVVLAGLAAIGGVLVTAGKQVATGSTVSRVDPLSMPLFVVNGLPQVGGCTVDSNSESRFHVLVSDGTHGLKYSVTDVDRSFGRESKQITDFREISVSPVGNWKPTNDFLVDALTDANLSDPHDPTALDTPEYGTVDKDGYRVTLWLRGDSAKSIDDRITKLRVAPNEMCTYVPRYTGRRLVGKTWMRYIASHNGCFAGWNGECAGPASFNNREVQLQPPAHRVRFRNPDTNAVLADLEGDYASNGERALLTIPPLLPGRQLPTEVLDANGNELLRGTYMDGCAEDVRCGRATLLVRSRRMATSF